MKSRGPSVQMPSVQPSQRLRLGRQISVTTAGWERGFCHCKWLIPRIIAPIRAYPRMKIKKPRRMNTKRMNGQGFLSFAVFFASATVHRPSVFAALPPSLRSYGETSRRDKQSSPSVAARRGGSVGGIWSYSELFGVKTKLFLVLDKELFHDWRSENGLCLRTEFNRKSDIASGREMRKACPGKVEL